MLTAIRELFIGSSAPRFDLRTYLLRRKFIKDADARLAFYRRLYNFLKNGVPVRQALEEIDGIYRQFSPADKKREILKYMIRDMERGVKISDAIARWVPSEEAILLEAGDASTSFDSILEHILEMSGSTRAMRRAVRSAMVKPAVIFVLALVVVTGYSVYVLPLILDAMPEVADTPTGQKLVAFTNGVVAGIVPGALLLFALVQLYVWAKDNVTGPIRYVLDRNVFAIHRTVQGTVFMVAVAGFLRAGIPLRDSLERIGMAGSRYLRWHTNRMARRLEEGKLVGSALNTGFLLPEVAINVAVFAEQRSDDFVSALQAVAEEALEDAVRRAEKIAGVMNGLAVAFLSISFLGLILGLVVMIFEFSSAARAAATSVG